MYIEATLPMSSLNLNPQTAAVTFLVHGTRNAKALPVIREGLSRLCGRFSETSGLPQNQVQYSFLEFVEPSLKDVLSIFAKQGQKDLYIVPLLLFPGTHLYEDVPQISEEIQKEHSGVTVHVAEHIGVDDAEFLDIVNKRLDKVV